MATEQCAPGTSASDPSVAELSTATPEPAQQSANPSPANSNSRSERHPSSSSTASSFDSSVNSPQPQTPPAGHPFQTAFAAFKSPGGGGSGGATSPRDFTHDLPEELLAQGWRRFWSKRENRPYYFNKVTNQSLWEMPPNPLKHRMDAGQHCQPPQKRPNLTAPHKPGAPWNFGVHSNCLMFERRPKRTFLPHPEVELLRAQLMAKLRQHYSELCTSRENIQPPPDSFNRWLLERYISDTGVDPLLPSNCDSELSHSMFREIINDLPVRLCRPKLSADAKKQLYRYAEASKAMIESRVPNPESRKIVKWNVEQTFQFLRQSKLPSYEDCLERLAHLKRTCQPHIEEAAKESVEKICSKVYHLSAEYARKCRELSERLFRLPDPADPWRGLDNWAGREDRKVRCYPAQICSPPPVHSPGVEAGSTDKMQFVRYKENAGCQMAISKQYFLKLQYLYATYCKEEDPHGEKFYPRLWCLLMRYNSFLGQQSSGPSTQAALPVPVFEALARLFDVTFELFASPLNCYFKQFCSAFPDTDCFFGSRGPMLDFYPIEGSFEANPPFSEELMVAMVNHMENLLKEATGPLSFVVFIPDWRDPPTDALIRLESSQFNRQQISILPFEHSYRNGLQHCLEKDADLHVRSAHGTLVVFLQNDAGFVKWAPTSEKIKDLRIAFGQTGGPSH